MSLIMVATTILAAACTLQPARANMNSSIPPVVEKDEYKPSAKCQTYVATAAGKQLVADATALIATCGQAVVPSFDAASMDTTTGKWTDAAYAKVTTFCGKCPSQFKAILQKGGKNGCDFLKYKPVKAIMDSIQTLEQLMCIKEDPSKTDSGVCRTNKAIIIQKYVGEAMSGGSVTAAQLTALCDSCTNRQLSAYAKYAGKSSAQLAQTINLICKKEGDTFCAVEFEKHVKELLSLNMKMSTAYQKYSTKLNDASVACADVAAEGLKADQENNKLNENMYKSLCGMKCADSVIPVLYAGSGSSGNQGKIIAAMCIKTSNGLCVDRFAKYTDVRVKAETIADRTESCDCERAAAKDQGAKGRMLTGSVEANELLAVPVRNLQSLLAAAAENLAGLTDAGRDKLKRHSRRLSYTVGKERSLLSHGRSLITAADCTKKTEEKRAARKKKVTEWTVKAKAECEANLVCKTDKTQCADVCDTVASGIADTGVFLEAVPGSVEPFGCCMKPFAKVDASFQTDNSAGQAEYVRQFAKIKGIKNFDEACGNVYIATIKKKMTMTYDGDLEAYKTNVVPKCVDKYCEVMPEKLGVDASKIECSGEGATASRRARVLSTKYETSLTAKVSLESKDAYMSTQTKGKELSPSQLSGVADVATAAGASGITVTDDTAAPDPNKKPDITAESTEPEPSTAGQLKGFSGALLSIGLTLLAMA